ncbi:MAG: glycosyltransferase [Deltaproteobacteria bacterium]|nr:glycosyltransferase [Deltaproteobacteria bacterium]
MKTSIIICFYEHLDFLKCCLDALKGSSRDFNEVVVADDGSGEDVVGQLKELIATYPFPVVHAWHRRQGARRAATRNNGIRHASGDYLVFLDADFLALPGAIGAHVAVAKPGQFAAGRCKYMTEDQTRRVIQAGVSEDLLEMVYRELSDRPILREHREFIRYGILRRLGLAPSRRQTFGGHFSIFRKDIESVNGYDENYIGWGGEDQDMAMRLVLAGFAGKSVIRSARMLHLWHTREMGDRHWKEGSNVEYYFRKDIPAFCENGLIKKGEGQGNSQGSGRKG